MAANAADEIVIRKNKNIRMAPITRRSAVWYLKLNSVSPKALSEKA
jgi:hypothetical protein